MVLDTEAEGLSRPYRDGEGGTEEEGVGVPVEVPPCPPLALAKGEGLVLPVAFAEAVPPAKGAPGEEGEGSREELAGQVCERVPECETEREKVSDIVAAPRGLREGSVESEAVGV